MDVTRVLGSGLAQTADAMRTALAGLLLQGGADEYEIAARSADAAREFLPLMTPLMEHTLRLHMRDQTRNQLFWQADGASPNLRQVWVAFADMVGFTRLGERIDPHDLGGLVTRLTDLALDTVTAPVRLVKTIGDAAMLVSPVAGPARGGGAHAGGAGRRAGGRVSASAGRPRRRVSRSAAAGTGTGGP